MNKVISAITGAVLSLIFAVPPAYSGERAENFLKGVKQFGLKRLSYNKVIDKGDLMEFDNLIGIQGDLQLITSRISVKDADKDSVIIDDISLMAGTFGGSATKVIIDDLSLPVSDGHPFSNLMIGNLSFFDAAGSSVALEKLVVTTREEASVRKVEAVANGQVSKDIFVSFLQPVLYPHDLQVDLGEMVDFNISLKSSYLDGIWEIDVDMETQKYGRLRLSSVLESVAEETYYKAVRYFSLVSWLAREQTAPLSILLADAGLRKMTASLEGTNWVTETLVEAGQGIEGSGQNVVSSVAEKVGVLAGATAARYVPLDDAKDVEEAIKFYVGDSQELLLSLKSSKKISEIFVPKPLANNLSIDIRVPGREAKRKDDATDRHE